MRPDSAENPEYALDKKRRLDDTALEKIRRGVQVADVVALDLEARAVVGAGGQNVLDVLERVPEDALVGRRQVALFPVELERAEALEHREEPEVHGAHVERRDLGLELQRGLQALLDGHRRRAASREIEHDVAAARDVRGEF